MTGPTSAPGRDGHLTLTILRSISIADQEGHFRAIFLDLFLTIFVRALLNAECI